MNQAKEVSRVTPLGLRFWDTLSDTPVGEGLNVAVYPVTNPARCTWAITNHAGIYIVQNLPGFQEIEFGSGDADYWANTEKKPFVVEVTDSQQRFQAFKFQADLPHRDLYTSPCEPDSSPLEPTSDLGIPLYSAVTRSIPSGFAVVRAQLWDVTNNQPAAWTLVEASYEGHFLARGFADRQGRLALLFPYPEPTYSISSPPGSPPIGDHPPLVDQSWLIQLHAFYAPQFPMPEIPDLCQIFNQSPATLLSTLSPVSPLTELLLHYAQELIVRSDSGPTVWIIP